MKTLEEMISHCEKVVEVNEKNSKYWNGHEIQYMKCMKRIEEYKQFIELLRELKAYKEDKHCCQYCKYREKDVDESPCDECRHNHVDCFEVRGDAE